MKIAEIFYSIQGEVDVGEPSIFIRFSGCNLIQSNNACKWCFGIKEGYHAPEVTLLNNTERKVCVNRIRKNDTLLTLDSNHNIVETKVIKVLTRKVRCYHKIQTNNNRVLFVTSEHPFFTQRGLVKCSDLMVGDKVYKPDTIKINYYQNYPPLSPPSNFTNQERNVIERKWYEYRKSLNKKYVGKKNPNYKNGKNGSNFNKLKYICSNGFLKCCKSCGKKGSLEVHHKDMTHTNDDDSNLTVLCHKCHSRYHRRGINFNRNKQQSKDEFVVITENTYVKDDEIKVTNLTCSPYNTYLVDGMWVHNCDSLWAEKGYEWALSEIMMEINKYPCKNVVITGGEPLYHKDEFEELVYELKRKCYQVVVETNGSFYNTILKKVDKVSCSPKKQSINIKILSLLNKLDNIRFKFVYEENDKWFEKIIEDVKINKKRVWVMPEGQTKKEQEKKMNDVVEYCKKNNYNFTPRIHILIWDKRRKV